MKYDFVLMDADETLLDFRKSEQAAFRNTFIKYGLIPDEEIFQLYSRINHGLWGAYERGQITKEDILRRRFRETFQAAGIKGEFPGLEEYYQNALSEGSYRIEGAEEVCSRLAETCSLYLVTNGVASTQRRRMKESGLQQYFQQMFISEEVGYQKPQIDFFEYVFARISGFDKSRALIVGDSLTSDIAGGRNAGIATCWFCRHGIPEDGAGKADYVICDLRKLCLIVGEQEDE
ncbi:MAG: YjjG family noncanonical pyrimidine nucleotidase [Lachnospiraceae bacterium]|nr:YjjG family noncanonical pyrimidine nucleotidase [Lachnospiraceae bacterium]